jgi:enoyl-CoA hydratase
MGILTYSIVDTIGFIEISNPPGNSLPDPVFEDETRLGRFLNSPELKAVMVKGRGRNFCNGADIDSLKTRVLTDTEFSSALDKGKKLLALFSNATVPVLACITGGCLGAGLELALSCHFRFASASAMLGFPEASLRLLPGFGGTQISLPTLSRSGLIELIISSRLIDGNEAHAMGLVDACEPHRDVMKKSLAFLNSLVGHRSHSLIRSIMISIRNGHTLSRQEALRKESELFLMLARENNSIPGEW